MEQLVSNSDDYGQGEERGGIWYFDEGLNLRESDHNYNLQITRLQHSRYQQR